MDEVIIPDLATATVDNVVKKQEKLEKAAPVRRVSTTDGQSFDCKSLQNLWSKMPNLT